MLQPSVAVQVRVIVAPGGQVPDHHVGVASIVGAVPQLSVAVAVPVTDGSVGVPHGSVTSGGQVIVTVQEQTPLQSVSVPVLTHAPLKLEARR